ncbi:MULTISPECIES: hypothetical protein [Rhizobium]|uniref:Uncharacterized protein n=1 Tax=Rhizobium rhododendri TaxID=2506430 RepID=A0ABY8ISC0_9HYPH|nr:MULTISPECIES: hypothetical protein [Rhizobium]MBZ5759491.1 hypothetical protein [Rhizobium sp. VS19-DR96]MBZ5765776.1 hypothetical protein [Rhizobium sp. VS19-DR129.2]MBZ5773860.1 hypothetical protein [Rhizobium sp. VS19-DRK62.2]MBZ5784932.1 hypothetical protein [Rhizobium sp. VS19-DR121]MBZ5801991.1 hypothetical protein [Rhizobium sp. VS19-DR181]
MQKFKIAVIREIEADSADEAALLMYQELSKAAAPLIYTLMEGAQVSGEIVLDRKVAEEFAEIDHTADPGNW